MFCPGGIFRLDLLEKENIMEKLTQAHLKGEGSLSAPLPFNPLGYLSPDAEQPTGATPLRHEAG